MCKEGEPSCSSSFIVLRLNLRLRLRHIHSRFSFPPTAYELHSHQPSISIDTDRNLDLDLRQTGSRSIDLDSENSRSSRSLQRRPSFRSSTPLQEADKPIRIRSTSPLPPPPYIRQAASTLTPPTAPNHDNINIVTHNIGGMTKTCHYCDAKS